MGHEPEPAKHTPGPWAAQPLAHGAFGIWDSLNRLVAETRNTASTVDKREGSPSTAAAIPANACLIAAAPAMLAALKAIRDMHVDRDTDHQTLSALCMAIAASTLRGIDAAS